jgi:predicted KAP-like P-loop ATPase
MSEQQREEAASPRPIPADNPIKDKEEDELGRSNIAETLAVEIRLLDASEGCVVGVLGPWGSGKTSLINLIREALKQNPELPVLEFNPWMFSGTDELLQTFFLEVGAQFRSRTDRLAELAGDIEAYGEVVAPLRLLPVIGTWVERARSIATGIRKALERRRGGALANRGELAKKLTGLKTPIVIVIDDIDRLQTNEIREIFKLVRLTASFPNIIYLLAFDRHRVESALTGEGLVGRDYLEKILQVSYDLPVIPPTLLTGRLTSAIDASLQDIEDYGPFDAQAWPDVLYEVVRPLIRNMRDVRRYVASLHGTLQSLQGRVALVDVLALEAVRVFLPDAFKALVAAKDGLTTPSVGGMYSQESPRLKSSVDELLKAAGDRVEVIQAMIKRLFLAAARHLGGSNYGPEWQKQWLRNRRIAHPEILAFYLERVVGDQLKAFTVAEKVLALVTDEAALNALFDGLGGAELADAIAALETYEDDFPVAGVEAASTVVLNQMHRVPARPGGFLTLTPDLIVARVVLRLLRRIEDPAALEAMVPRVLSRLPKLSDRLELLTIVGHEENAGHGLISEEAAAALDRELRSQVRTAGADALAQEHDLLRLLVWAKKSQESGEEPLEVPHGLILDARLLKASVTKSESRSFESRAVSTRKQLYWDTLVEVVGGEQIVREMVERLGPMQDDPDLAEAVKLAEKYLTGWRPSRYEK